MIGLLGLGIEELGTFAVALHLCDVSHIIEGEGIGGIKLIGFLKVFTRRAFVIAVESRNSL